MKSLWKDVRYGARMLMKAPFVSLVAVLSLAVGIGANSAMFSVANGFFFEPLRWHDADRVVMAYEHRLDQTGAELRGLSAANFLDWRDVAESYSSWQAYTMWAVNLSGGGRPERAQMVETTPGIFDVLGRGPFLGRGFTADEGRGADADVVVLTHNFWVRRFASDEAVVGQVLRLDGRPHTVVGVLPADFDFLPANGDLFRPSDLSQMREAREARDYFSIARLKDGVDVGEAQRELTALAASFAERYPDTNRGYGASVRVARTLFPGPTDTSLQLILLAVTGFVLVLAGVNVANLLLARADERQKEIALRTALGAGRARILRQLVTESVLLSLVGAALGIAFSVWGVRVVVSSMPAELPSAFFPRLDGGVLVATLVLAVAVGVLLGLAPALHSFGDLRSSLGDSSRGGTASRKRQRLRSVFVVAQIAVALAILAGAGVLGDAFTVMVEENRGFDPDELVTLQLVASQDRYSSDAEVAAFYREVERELRALPGASDVAVMSRLPRSRAQTPIRFTIDGQPQPEPNEEPAAHLQVVNGSYFDTLGMSLVRGRALHDRDRAETAPVAVVNESFVRRYLEDGSGLGERFTWSGKSWDVVGVAADALLTRMIVDQGIFPTVYLPLEQAPSRELALAIKTPTPVEVMADDVRQAVWNVDPELPVAGVQSLWNHIEIELSGPKVLSQTLTVFGALALLLSTIGTYGVIAHHAAQRSREIGIRMALGAGRANVLGWITKRGLVLAGLGFAVGLPMAFGVVQVLQSAFLGVVPVRLSYLASVVAALAFLSVVASVLPAHRASRVQPTVALQDD